MGMKKVLIVVAVLGALLASAGAAGAHKGGPQHGNTYAKNYYPQWYFSYCKPDGARYVRKNAAAKKCEKNYGRYKEKWQNGKKYYYMLAQFEGRGLPGASSYRFYDVWYYCQHHRYDDPDQKTARLQCQVTNRVTGKRYWERFDREKVTVNPLPETFLVDHPPQYVYKGDSVLYSFRSNEADATFECRAWGSSHSGDNIPTAWQPCNTPYRGKYSYSYKPSDKQFQHFEVRAVDKIGQEPDPTPVHHDFMMTSD